MYQITDENRTKLITHLAQLPWHLANPLLAFLETNLTVVAEDKPETDPEPDLDV